MAQMIFNVRHKQKRAKPTCHTQKPDAQKALTIEAKEKGQIDERLKDV